MSKQCNLFDGYLMTPAAMSYDARSPKNNSFFMCTSNKKLSVVDMLPPIVDDLEELEKRIEIYSITDKQTVLVAPLFLIQADNYRHSELSMHKGSAAGCFCRKCTIRSRKNPNPKPRKNANAEKRAEMNLALQRPKELLPVTHMYTARTIEELCLLRDTADDRVKETMDKNGYTVNGSEQLLHLESFDLTLDTPVELLHTLPLGVGKSLMQFLLKITLTTAERAIFQAALTEYRHCRAYSRNFRALVNHNGFFLGRDFKQLTQVIPVILKSKFPNCTKGGVLDLTAKCFDVYGCLSPLVYMRNFSGDEGKFISLISHFVDELAKCVLELDNHSIRIKKTPTCLLSLQPKLHMLHHIVADIKRFDMPVNYETEHGEQFNKFIRKEILCKNRHNPSKDVTVAFARRSIIHHVVSGGSFLVDYENPVTKCAEIRRVVDVSSGTKQLKIDEPDFFTKLFDSRENADNNDYLEASKMTVNTSGIFKCKSPNGIVEFFGTITKANRDKYTIQKYVFEPFNASLSSPNIYRSALFPQFLTTIDNNLVVKPVGEETDFALVDVQLQQRFDMHSKYSAEGFSECRLLNIHKFGSLWPLLKMSSG